MSKQKIALLIALGALIISLIIICFPTDVSITKEDKRATYAYPAEDVISCYQDCLDDYSYYTDCLEEKLGNIESSIIYTGDTYDELWDTINEISDEVADSCNQVSIYSCRCM